MPKPARKLGRPPNRPYNDPTQLGTDSCYGSAESRASDRVAAELCAQGPMGFHTLLLALPYSEGLLRRVLKDSRFVETTLGWDLKPLRTEGAKYGDGTVKSTAGT